MVFAGVNGSVGIRAGAWSSAKNCRSAMGTSKAHLRSGIVSPQIHSLPSQRRHGSVGRHISPGRQHDLDGQLIRVRPPGDAQRPKLQRGEPAVKHPPAVFRACLPRRGRKAMYGRRLVEALQLSLSKLSAGALCRNASVHGTVCGSASTGRARPACSKPLSTRSRRCADLPPLIQTVDQTVARPRVSAVGAGGAERTSARTLP